MAIKRFPVERIYFYRLFCDNCGEEMVKGNIAQLTNPPTFEYNCKKCGMHHLSKVEYPYLYFKLNELLPDVVDEESIFELINNKKENTKCQK